MRLPFTSQSLEAIRGTVDGLLEDAIQGLATPMEVSEPTREIAALPHDVVGLEQVNHLHALDRMNEWPLASS